MEKKKIVTSLTLAGILTAGVLGGNSNAASNSQGVCKNIISGESLVPYILESAEDKDVVTSARLKAEYTTASNLELKYTDRVRTGDTFTTTTGKKTVLVYGDVNQDGKVTTLDASYAQSIVLGANATELQKAAADVRRNNTSINVTTVDASSIQEFVLNGGDYVNVKPVGAKDEVSSEAEYNLTVDAGKGINNQNYNKLKATLTPKTEFLDEEADLTVKIKKLDEKTGKYGTASNLSTFKKADVQSNRNSVEIDLDLSKTVNISKAETNGTYKIEVLRGTTVVAETDITTHVFNDTTSKLKANVYARRVGSENAEINVVGYGEGNIEKVYCSLTSYSNGADLKKNGIGVTVTNNETRSTFTNNEVPSATQKVYYVIEDSYGNLLYKNSVDVAADTKNNAPIASIKKIEAVNNANQFTVTVERANGVLDTTPVPVTVILYKDGKAIDSKTATVKANDTSVVTAAFADMGKETGSYTVKAYVNGDTANQPSDMYNSTSNENGTITVSSLEKATNITLNEVTDQYKGTVTKELSWDYAGNEEVNYIVEYKLSTGDWDVAGDVTTITVANGEKKLDVTSRLNANKIYDVRVKVQLKTPDNTKIASTSDDKRLFTLKFTSANNRGTVTKTKNSIKLTKVTPLPLTGKSADATDDLVTTYRVKVWNHESSEDHTESNCIINKDVVLTKEEKGGTYESPAIEGLQPGASYDVYVYAVYDGVESEDDTTKFNYSLVKTDFNEIAIDFDVDNTLTAPKAGKIKVNTGNTAYIDTENVTDTNVFSTEYQAVLNNVVSKLATGDHVKVIENDVTITLADVTDAVAFGDLKGLNVTIIGNKNYRQISNTNTDLKEETIVLQDGLFTVSKVLVAKTVTLNNAKLQSIVGKYIVSNNTTSTINNVDVNATVADAEIAPTKNKLTITPSESVLDITNSASIKTAQDLQVIFQGDSSNEISQSGDVKVTSKVGGNVTITAANADINGNITADVKGKEVPEASLASNAMDKLVISAPTNKTIKGNINVTIENATIDLKDAKLTGAKSVNIVNVKDDKADPKVAELTEVKGILKTNAPFKTTGTITVKNNYKVDDDTETISGLTLIGTSTLADAKTFINNLGLPETAGAEISITEDANKVQTVVLTFKGNANYTFNGELELK